MWFCLNSSASSNLGNCLPTTRSRELPVARGHEGGTKAAHIECPMASTQKFTAGDHDGHRYVIYLTPKSSTCVIGGAQVTRITAPMHYGRVMDDMSSAFIEAFTTS